MTFEFGNGYINGGGIKYYGGYTHFMEEGLEVSMTTHKLRHVKTDLPMLSLNPQPYVFDQHRFPAPSRLLV